MVCDVAEPSDGGSEILFRVAIECEADGSQVEGSANPGELGGLLIV